MPILMECNTGRTCFPLPTPNLNLKSFPSHKGPLGGTDLRFNSPQPDTSRSCKSTDTGLVCCVECLFKFPACTGTNLLLGEQRHVCEQLAQSWTWSAMAGNRTIAHYHNKKTAIHSVQKITIICAQKIGKSAVWNLILRNGAIWRHREKF